MRIFLRKLPSLLALLLLTSLVSAQNHYYVAINGNNTNDGRSLGSAKATINAALTAAAAGDVIHVTPGTYTEKVNINKQGIKLVSTEGATVTFINPSTAAGVGTVAIATGINNVTIGESGKGFTITGFDGDGGSETGAIFLDGSHNNIYIEGNTIVANGEHGLGSKYNAAIDNLVINDNIFSGKTFVGAEPGGCDFSTTTQFAPNNNVPRQMVVLGGGPTTTATKNVIFTNNKIIGITGGYNSASGCIQGNTQVTIDVIGATISGNIFDGITTDGSNLRTRGNATSISCNTFYNRNLGTSATHIFFFDQDPLTGANPSSITGVLEANSFPDGGAAFTSGYSTGSINTYTIYRDATQAATVNQILGTSFNIATGPSALASLPQLFDYSVVSDINTCGAVVELQVPSPLAFCNTVIASITNDVHSSNLFEVGTTKVIWTVTDIHGNTDTAWQFVTVIDNQNPTIHPVTPVVSCANATGSYTLPALSVSDNCGISSINYIVSGATNRTGTGVEASGVFNIGVSTVTYTVTDIHGNSRSYAYDVTIQPAAAATYTVSSPDAFCNQLSLTVNGSSWSSYQWSLAGNTVGTQAILNLGLTNPDGVYQLQVTDKNGCVSTPVTYAYQKQTVAGNYTLLASTKLALGVGNRVASGSVGVSGTNGVASFEANSSVASSGSFVKAPAIVRNGSGIQLASVITGTALVTLPTMQKNTVSTRSLSNYTVNRNTVVTLAANYNSLTVRKGADVILNGNIFGIINIEEGAKVRFTQTVLDIAELNVQAGVQTNFTTVRFANGTSIRISNKVQISGNTRVNPDQHKATFYLGDLNSDDEFFNVKGSNIQFTGNVYLPNGAILLSSEKGWNNNMNANVSMSGFFIAEEIQSTIPYVIWSSYTCGSQPVYVSNGFTSIQFTSDEEKKKENPFTVQVIGNPSTSFFTLKLQSQRSQTIQLRVTDATGRMVDSRANNQPNSTVQIGHQYAPGTYFVELTQGTDRKVVQLMKIR
ncbi:MAG: T9SS type A sorting domain-containing protein [Sediminibacterium sp.]|uniref:T9SS type A sorting domain-containing protein n=1 Tax=Sediminibacterium sp. TaxID=1917865 RepID=UPI002ABC2C29|nr:T9SS type A sorting domain-containing protein [Sediminibacterium sp.]MDZ4071811.1 T9SS type A sorting domain-containing protein [Sediminibacterium sp.]